MSASSPIDFLELEALLIARLEQTVKVSGRAIDVFSFADMPKGKDGDIEYPSRVPCLMTVYEGYRVKSSEAANKAIIEQIFTVSVAVANVRDRGREGARADAGPLLGQVAQYLMGWFPQAPGVRGYTQLQLASPLYPPVYKERLSLFPLAFTTDRPVHGAPLNKVS